MVIDVLRLPDAVRRAAAQARLELAPTVIESIDWTPLSPKFAAWAHEYLTSGELGRDLREASSDDPDVAE
jgi:hypothetical protein